MAETVHEHLGEKSLFYDGVVVLLKRMKLVLAVTSAAAFIAIVISFVLPKEYEGKAKLLPRQDADMSMSAALLSTISSALSVPSGLTGLSGTPSDLYADMLMNSRSIADAIIDRFNLMAIYDKDTRADTRIELSDNVGVRTDKKSGIVTITMLDENPKRAADIANAYVEELIKLNNRIANSSANQRQLFFKAQLDESLGALTRAEEDLKGFAERTGAIKIDAQVGAIFSNIAELRAQIVLKEIQLRVMKTYSTSHNRDVKQLVEELDGLKEQLNKLESGKDRYGNTIIPMDQMPKLGVDYQRKLRELVFQEKVFELLTKQYEAARMDQAKALDCIQVVDFATVPDKKAKPKRAMIIILTTVSGFIIAVCMALFWERWEGTSGDPVHINRMNRINEYLGALKRWPVVVRLRRFFRKNSDGRD
jgi:tyrosine-protein kinase Etk/Wzc